MKIDGTVALVTGANRGLGRAFARALTELGARRVYAGARHPENVIDPGVEPVKLDITSASDIAEALHHCREVSLLINNAADARPGSLTGAGSLENARAQMETNYLGTLAMCQAFAPVLARNGGGAIVNMLSIVSFFNYPALASFCPTKAALWSLTNGIRMELRPQGTLVVGVHASFIDTRLSAEVDAPKHAPADVAALVLAAVEAGEEEVLVDERTRAMKAAIPRDLELIYPDIEAHWKASQAFRQQ